MSTHNIFVVAIMVLPPDDPGGHPDSFQSTEPFGFSAATYFVPMTALLGGQWDIWINLFIEAKLCLLTYSMLQLPLQVWQLESYQIAKVASRVSFFVSTVQLLAVCSSILPARTFGRTMQ